MRPPLRAVVFVDVGVGVAVGLGVLVATAHGLVLRAALPCTPLRSMLTAPKETTESPANRPTAGVSASRLVIVVLLVTIVGGLK
jgi:hypothetical protein